jgi:hypothetical protein
MPSETRITQCTSSSVHGLSFWLAVFPTALLAHFDPSQSHTLLAGYFQMSPSFHLINSMGRNTSVGIWQVLWWTCQEFSYLLWNSKIHHHLQQCLLFHPNMSQLNSIHNFKHLFHTLTEVSRAFSSVVRQMPVYNSPRRGTVRTVPIYFCVVLCIFLCCSMYCLFFCRSVNCLCVNVYYTTATGWQPNCS